MPRRRAADNLNNVLEHLLQFYQNSAYTFGSDLRSALDLDDDTEITTEHVRQYYAENEDFVDPTTNDVTRELLERGLRTLKIELALIILLDKGAVEHFNRVAQQIKDALQAKLEQLDDAAREALGIADIKRYIKDEFPITLKREDLISKLIEFLEATQNTNFKVVLSNDELADLYTKVVNSLELNRPGFRAVQAVVDAISKPTAKPSDTKSQAEQVITSAFDRLQKPHTEATTAAYKKDNTERPSRMLEPLDFAGLEVPHKDLLISKLRKLKEKNPEDAERFCGVIRKLLLSAGKSALEQQKLNAKIKYALGKLCQVLRKQGLDTDADAIESQVFNRDYVGKFAKFKEEEMALPGIKDKVVSALKDINGFVTKYILRNAVLTDEEYAAAVPDNIEGRVTNFAAMAQQYPDYLQASRKIVNKCRSVARALNEIAIERATQDELAACGVVLNPMDPLLSLPLRDFTRSYDLFKQKSGELFERSTLRSDLAPGAALPAKMYLPEQEVQHSRKVELRKLYNAAELLSNQLLAAKNANNQAALGPLMQRLEVLCNRAIANARNMTGREQLEAIEDAKLELQQCKDIAAVFIQSSNQAQHAEPARAAMPGGFPFPFPRA
jgi:hypothetical protein